MLWQQAAPRALVVVAGLPGAPADEDDLTEAVALAVAAGAHVIDQLLVQRSAADARTLIGSGKVAEIAQRVLSSSIDLVIFGSTLSPSQERNLTRALACPVVDRIGLILDIFSRRARSHEGKLQVELAQLKHLQTRLVRGWTHLERQAGGIGMRGPGETQLETDRRLVRARITHLDQRLVRVARQRTQGRRARARAGVPSVALVGYTNSGKSTLFNCLTEAGVLAVDQLFATLDSTVRRVEMPDCVPVVLADTVGFVRNLPHDLVAAFRSTLEEVREATLLVHVVDATRPDRGELSAAVNSVLHEIGAGELPQIEVYNKIDCLDEPPRHEPAQPGSGRPARVWLSAHTGAGMAGLHAAIAEHFAGLRQRHQIVAPQCPAQLRARLYEWGQVLEERFTADGSWCCDFEMSPAHYARLAPLMAAAQVH